MEVIMYTSISLSKTQNLHLEDEEGLEESEVKRHVRRRGRRPASLMGKRWAKWWQRWNGLFLSTSALRLRSFWTSSTSSSSASSS